MWRATRQKGFTIVELLIVVVVIAILAAITIIGYNGITQRAKESVAKDAVATAMKKIAVAAVDNADVFPADLSSLNLPSSNGVTYQYSVNNSTNPKGYCITATANGTSYYLGSNFTYTSGSTSTTNQSTPTSGACPGHGTGGVAITNYSLNPGAEVNASGFSGPNGSTTVRDTSIAHKGVGSVLVTMPVNGSSSTVGSAVFNYSDFTTILEPSTTYTASAWVWVPSGTVGVIMSVQGSGRASTTNPAERITAVKGQWVRIYNTLTTGASGNLVIYILNNAATTVAGTQFWIDDVMIVKGDTPANYADGNTPGWVWNGAAGNSTSKGPAV